MTDKPKLTEEMILVIESRGLPILNEERRSEEIKALCHYARIGLELEKERAELVEWLKKEHASTLKTTEIVGVKDQWREGIASAYECVLEKLNAKENVGDKVT